MKVILRKLRVSDAEISYKWRNDPEIWKYTGSRPDKIITPEIEKKWISEVLHKNDQKRFAICVNDDQKYIGNVQLTNIKDNKAEFHIFIGEKEFWGKGVASEATRCMVQFGFEILKLQEIFLFVHKDNIPAIKAYLKCGFIYRETYKEQITMVIRNE